MKIIYLSREGERQRDVVNQEVLLEHLRKHFEGRPEEFVVFSRSRMGTPSLQQALALFGEARALIGTCVSLSQQYRHE